jgi:ubiquinone/menaquinone biosynthesis C-methylase UbiE
MDKVGKQTLLIMRKVSWYNRWLFSFVKPYLKGRILEVGGGIGNFTELLSSYGELYTTDIDKNYLKILKKKFGNIVRVGYGDVEKGKFFFGDTRFDAVVIMNVLEHIRDDEKALTNMFKLLKKGGYLIVLVPAFEFSFGTLDKNLSHYRRYTTSSLAEKIKKHSGRVVVSRYLNTLGILGWFVNSRLSEKEIIPESQLSIFSKIARPFLVFERIVSFPFGLSVLNVSQKK